MNAEIAGVKARRNGGTTTEAELVEQLAAARKLAV